MSLAEVITETIKILRSVVVPAGLPVDAAYGITKPVIDAIANLTACMNAIEKHAEEATEKKEGEG